MIMIQRKLKLISNLLEQITNGNVFLFYLANLASCFVISIVLFVSLPIGEANFSAFLGHDKLAEPTLLQ